MLFHAVPTQRDDQKRSPTSTKRIVSSMLSSFLCLWTLSTTIVLDKVLTKTSTKQQLNATTGEILDHSTSLLSNDIIDMAEISFNLKDDPFCNSIQGARANGPTNRTMIQTFVSNSGHLPFLHNALLSMRESKLPWKPLVLAIGTDLCPMITNLTSQNIMDSVICVPYLDRLLNQLQRDEPQSLEQIQTALTEHNDTSQSSFHRIEQILKSAFGWGSGVEYKFLINAKLYALRDVMECGSDVFITDTDIGFRQDPRPYFDVDGEEGDIIGQNDTNSEMYKLNLNSGFMYWKATERNMELIDDIIKGKRC